MSVKSGATTTSTVDAGAAENSGSGPSIVGHGGTTTAMVNGGAADTIPSGAPGIAAKDYGALSAPRNNSSL